MRDDDASALQMNTTSPCPRISPADINELENRVVVIAQRFDGRYPEAVIYQYLFESYADLLRTATVHNYLATLAERRCIERLRSCRLDDI